MSGGALYEILATRPMEPKHIEHHHYHHNAAPVGGKYGPIPPHRPRPVTLLKNEEKPSELDLPPLPAVRRAPGVGRPRAMAVPNNAPPPAELDPNGILNLPPPVPIQRRNANIPA
jgi:hypothetical protein